jgi:S-adenosylmethionine/arginine decarboxylase-like enzyme
MNSGPVKTVIRFDYTYMYKEIIKVSMDWIRRKGVSTKYVFSNSHVYIHSWRLLLVKNKEKNC